MFSFIANLKIKFFYSTSKKSGSLYNMVHLTVAYGELCLQSRLSVCWLGLCLLLVLLVCYLGVRFGIGFVGFVFVGWCLCDHIISFNSRNGVSVGLFY